MSPVISDRWGLRAFIPLASYLSPLAQSLLFFTTSLSPIFLSVVEMPDGEIPVISYRWELA